MQDFSLFQSTLFFFSVSSSCIANTITTVTRQRAISLLACYDHISSFNFQLHTIYTNNEFILDHIRECRLRLFLSYFFSAAFHRVRSLGYCLCRFRKVRSRSRSYNRLLSSCVIRPCQGIQQIRAGEQEHKPPAQPLRLPRGELATQHQHHRNKDSTYDQEPRRVPKILPGRPKRQSLQSDHVDTCPTAYRLATGGYM